MVFIGIINSKVLEIMNDKILSVIRHLLTAVGSILLTKGLLDEAMLEEVVGATITLIGFAWGIWDKRKK